MENERIRMREAAERRNTTRQSIYNAIKAGKLTAEKGAWMGGGNLLMVICDEKWEKWNPNPIYQVAGAVRHAGKFG